MTFLFFTLLLLFTHYKSKFNLLFILCQILVLHLTPLVYQECSVVL